MTTLLIMLICSLSSNLLAANITDLSNSVTQFCNATSPAARTAAVTNGMQLLRSVLPQYAHEYQEAIAVVQNGKSMHKTVKKLTGEDTAAARWLVASSTLLCARAYGTRSHKEMRKSVAQCAAAFKSQQQKVKRTGKKLLISMLLLSGLITGAAAYLITQQLSYVPKRREREVNKTIIPVVQQVRQEDAVPAAAPAQQPLPAGPPTPRLQGSSEIFPDNGPDPVDLVKGPQTSVGKSVRSLWNTMVGKSDGLLDTACKGAQLYATYKCLFPPTHASAPPVIIQPPAPPTPIIQELPTRAPIYQQSSQSGSSPLLKAGLLVLGGAAIYGAYKWLTHKKGEPDHDVIPTALPIVQALPVQEVSTVSPQEEPSVHTKQYTYETPNYHIMPPSGNERIRLKRDEHGQIERVVEQLIADARHVQYPTQEDTQTAVQLHTKLKQVTAYPYINLPALNDALARAYVLSTEKAQRKKAAHLAAAQKYENSCLSVALAAQKASAKTSLFDQRETSLASVHQRSAQCAHDQAGRCDRVSPQ